MSFGVLSQGMHTARLTLVHIYTVAKPICFYVHILEDRRLICAYSSAASYQRSRMAFGCNEDKSLLTHLICTELDI